MIDVLENLKIVLDKNTIHIYSEKFDNDTVNIILSDNRRESPPPTKKIIIGSMRNSIIDDKHSGLFFLDSICIMLTLLGYEIYVDEKNFDPNLGISIKMPI